MTGDEFVVWSRLPVEETQVMSLDNGHGKINKFT